MMDRAAGAAAQLRGFSAAISFLTRLPSHRAIPHDASDLTRATAYFPIVGLIVGAAAGVVFAVASLLWSPTLAAILSVAFTVWMTGAFHEDALADSLDGFGGGWTKEQVLTIMKDSRVGSYALVGVALVLAAKIAAITTLFDNARAQGVGFRTPVVAVSAALIAAHVLARWSSVLLMRTTSYVRVTLPDERSSAGRPFAGRASVAATIVSSVFALLIVGIVLKGQAIIAVGVTVVVTWIAQRYFLRRIDGITGDALGAANQLVELCVYLSLAAHFTIS